MRSTTNTRDTTIIDSLYTPLEVSKILKISAQQVYRLISLRGIESI